MAYTYTNEIANAGIKNVIPSYAPFSEAYFYLQEATENDWAELTRSIGLYELGVLEATGAEVVYEADDNSEAAPKNKIAKFFADAWARIKGLYDVAIKAIQEACNNAKEKFKNSRSLRLDEAQFKEGTKFGKYRDYSSLEYALSKTQKDESFDGGEHQIVLGKEFDADAEFVKKNWSNLVDIAFEFKFTKAQIVKNYTDVKKAFDDAVKAAKSGDNGEALKGAKAKVTNLNKYASQICKLYHERQRRALAIVAKAALLTMKKSEAEKAESKKAKEEKNSQEAKTEQKPEKTNESAVLESYTSDIGKLFDWDF